MHAWPTTDVPLLPRPASPGTLRLHDTATGGPVPVTPDGTARLYVCGITPYDATHLGHAATYLAFDLLVRVWRDQGLAVLYGQNVTDIDDPLLERATRDGVDWAALAEQQIELFRADMTALRVLPPTAYVGAVESIPMIAVAVARLLDAGIAYRLDDDVYCSAEAIAHFGEVAGLDRATMTALSAERGGDPERVGKKDPLDSLLWLAARPGEPSWDSPLGAGRPGWHVECACIAMDHLGATLDVQGGARTWPTPTTSTPPRPPRRSPGSGRSPGRTSTPGWSAWTARRCPSRAATWFSSRCCAVTGSTRPRSGSRCRASTTAATASGPRRR